MFVIALNSETEFFLQDAEAEKLHQDLVVCHARSHLHCRELVEQGDDIFMIKEWTGFEQRAPQGVLHVCAESLVGIQRCRGAEKWMFLPLVDSFADHVANSFPENELFRHATNLHVHRLKPEKLNN